MTPIRYPRNVERDFEGRPRGGRPRIEDEPEEPTADEIREAIQRVAKARQQEEQP